MLELSQVLSDITAMGAEARLRFQRVSDELEQALALESLDESDWASVRERAETAPWPVARLGEDSPFTVYPLPEAAPAVYTAIATDGSQIPLDRHAIAPCYLLNVGEIVLHYGTGERPRL